MKTELEKEIKNQLSQKKIQPSLAAWGKLEKMLDQEKNTENKTKKTWIPWSVAASVVMILTVVLVFNNKPKSSVQQEIQPVVVNHETVNTEISDSQNSITRNQEVNEEAKTIITQNIANNETVVEAIEQPKNRVTEIVAENELIESDKTENNEIQQEILIGYQKDSVKIIKKRPDFVDPEMLLYSVEHNQSIQKQESNSKLVIIDFNK